MYKEIDWKSCYSMSEDHEHLALERWAKEAYDKKNADLSILEIGSFHGRSTALLAQFGKVMSIDLHSNIDIGINAYETIGQMAFPDFIKNMIRLKLIDTVFPVISTCNFLDFLPNMQFDFIFIDADHHYEEVKKDIDKSIRHLSEDGYLVLHDYLRDGYSRPPYDPNHPHHTFDPKKDPWWGVAKAANELISLGEFAIQEHYHGILLLKRTEFITQPVIVVP